MLSCRVHDLLQVVIALLSELLGKRPKVLLQIDWWLSIHLVSELMTSQLMDFRKLVRRVIPCHVFAFEFVIGLID